LFSDRRSTNGFPLKEEGQQSSQQRPSTKGRHHQFFTNMPAGSISNPAADRLTAQYSPVTGLIYIFNLIVGTGALTLPAAFHDAGWLLSSVIIILLAFMSYLTATFVIESMASANALVHHRRLQRLKRSSTHASGDDQQSSSTPVRRSTDDAVRILPAIDGDDDDGSSSSGRATPSNFHFVNNQTDDEGEPLLSDDHLSLRRPLEASRYVLSLSAIACGARAHILYPRELKLVMQT
jgi:hypothetical protein